jgi:3-polyprenyl-4-hydroxybenzoate decarboxylase
VGKGDIQASAPSGSVRNDGMIIDVGVETDCEC